MIFLNREFNQGDVFSVLLKAEEEIRHPTTFVTFVGDRVDYESMEIPTHIIPELGNIIQVTVHNNRITRLNNGLNIPENICSYIVPDNQEQLLSFMLEKIKRCNISIRFKSSQELRRLDVPDYENMGSKVFIGEYKNGSLSGCTLVGTSYIFMPNLIECILEISNVKFKSSAQGQCIKIKTKNLENLDSSFVSSTDTILCSLTNNTFNQDILNQVINSLIINSDCVAISGSAISNDIIDSFIFEQINKKKKSKKYNKKPTDKKKNVTITLSEGSSLVFRSDGKLSINGMHLTRKEALDLLFNMAKQYDYLEGVG